MDCLLFVLFWEVYCIGYAYYLSIWALATLFTDFFFFLELPLCSLELLSILFFKNKSQWYVKYSPTVDGANLLLKTLLDPREAIFDWGGADQRFDIDMRVVLNSFKIPNPRVSLQLILKNKFLWLGFHFFPTPNNTMKISWKFCRPFEMVSSLNHLLINWKWNMSSEHMSEVYKEFGRDTEAGRLLHTLYGKRWKKMPWTNQQFFNFFLHARDSPSLLYMYICCYMIQICSC